MKLVKQAKTEEEARAEERRRLEAAKVKVSPYDIILGKIDLDYQQIPEYM